MHMKHIILIVFGLMFSGAAFADSGIETPVVVKASSQPKASAELISARIKSALEGKRYTLVAACDDDGCKTGPR